MQNDMRIEFFDIEICAIEELFIIIIIIIMYLAINMRSTQTCEIILEKTQTECYYCLQVCFVLGFWKSGV